jgi:predicted dehydrogenase
MKDLHSPMKNKEIRIAQLGCGYWGPNLLRNFSAQPSCHVRWVAEQDPKRRAYVESNYPKTQTTESWEQAVHDPDVDAIIIATPAATHYALGKAALEAGKHIFVEKPLATTVAEADDLVQLAESRGRTLMLGDTFLYNAAVRHLKKLVDAGELGKVYYVYSQRLNLGRIRTDVNAWWNLAPHDISILLYLMDWELPVSVSARGFDYVQPGIEDVVFASLVWANGVTGHIHVSWLDPGKIRKMTVVGNRKMVVYDDVADDKIAVFDKGIDRVAKLGEGMDYDHFNNYQLLHRQGDVLLPRIDFQEPLKVEASHFLESIRLGRPPLTGPMHGRSAVAILEAGHKSLRSNGAVVTLESATASRA